MPTMQQPKAHEEPLLPLLMKCACFQPDEPLRKEVCWRVLSSTKRWAQRRLSRRNPSVPFEEIERLVMTRWPERVAGANLPNEAFLATSFYGAFKEEVDRVPPKKTGSRKRTPKGTGPKEKTTDGADTQASAIPFDEALAALPERARQMVILHVELGYAPAAIARALGITGADADREVQKELEKTVLGFAKGMLGPRFNPESTQGLLIRAQLGDNRAREAFYGHLMPRLERWAHHKIDQRMRSLETTRDLVQNVFLRLIEGERCFWPRHEAALVVYLYRAVRNKVTEINRKSAAKQLEIDIDDPHSALPSDDRTGLRDVVSEEEFARFERALACLSLRDQALIIRRHVLQMTFPEIAGEMGITEGAANMGFRRALIRLNDAMGGEGPSARGASKDRG